jgi:hypothetical protein
MLSFFSFFNHFVKGAFMSTISMSEVARQLSDVQSMLNRTLKDALSRGFKPDVDFVDDLEPYMKSWGHRTVHEFMIYCANSDAREAPDLMNGEMAPYNFFRVLYPLYIGYDR